MMPLMNKPVLVKWDIENTIDHNITNSGFSGGISTSCIS